MSVPKTHGAVVAREPGKPFTIEQIPVPTPSAGQVLVKVLACGVCFSDLGMTDGHYGDVFPRIPGHEIVGDIVQVGGGDTTAFSVGDRIGGGWHAGQDNTCKQCRRGRFQICDNRKVHGVSVDGGFAEYAIINTDAAVRVPKDMDPADAAPLLCAGVTVFNSMRNMQRDSGALVAINGLGGLGHLAVQYARKMGFEVVAMSTSDSKKAFATDLGAHHFINTKSSNAIEELKKLGGADLIVHTATTSEGLGDLVGGLAATGRLLLLAPVGPVEISSLALILEGTSVHGWPSGHAQDSEEAIKFAQTHGVKCMVNKYAFKDVQQAMDDLREGKPRFRNVLIM